MKKFELLKEEFPNTFKDWMDEDDIKEILDRKWTSRESNYIMENGIGTYDVNEAKIYKDEHGNDVCDSYCNIEVEFRKYIKVYMLEHLYDYDEEEKTYTTMVNEMKGWE